MIGRDLRVCLEPYEMDLAAHVGIRRQVQSLARGLPDKHGYEGDGWSIHIHGAGGEIAFAKAMGMYWDGSVNTFKAPDLPGSNIQIRTRSGIGSRDSLIVRPGDRDDDVFVLVVGMIPEFRVSGWITGFRAKHHTYLKTYGDRPAAYFVPQSALWPFPIKKAA